MVCLVFYIVCCKLHFYFRNKFVVNIKMKKRWHKNLHFLNVHWRLLATVLIDFVFFNRAGGLQR